jgi:exonuclease III
VLKEMVEDQHCRIIVCIQETKVQNVDDAFVQSCLGPRFIGSYVTQPANGTCGGLLLACSNEHYSIMQVDVRRSSVTVQIKQRKDNAEWSLTGVYGPQSDNDKIEFLQELRQLKQAVQTQWLLLGDFNLIYRACDKATLE